MVRLPIPGVLESRPQVLVSLTFVCLLILGVVAAKVDVYHLLVGPSASWWRVLLIHVTALLPIWAVTALLIDRFHRQEVELAGRLRQTDEMKDRILSVLTESLIEPAANLAECAELLRNQDLHPEDLTSTLPLLRESSVGAHQLLSDLQVWARHQQSEHAGSIGAVHLGEALEHACSRIETDFRSREVELHWTKVEAVVLTDREAILVILRNLLRLAARTARRTTQADLTVSRQGERWRIQLASVPRGSGSRTRVAPRISGQVLGECAIHALCRDLVVHAGGAWHPEASVEGRLIVGFDLPAALG